MQIKILLLYSTSFLNVNNELPLIIFYKDLQKRRKQSINFKHIRTVNNNKSDSLLSHAKQSNVYGEMQRQNLWVVKTGGAFWIINKSGKVFFHTNNH